MTLRKLWEKHLRTLHADLTTAQQSASATPYILLSFRSRDGLTTRTYSTADATNRVARVNMSEGRLGGELNVSGSQIPYSAIIRLSDDNNALAALDWKGYRLDIGWGFNTASGNRYSEGPPLYVHLARTVSAQGVRYLELICMDLWSYVGQVWKNQSTSAPVIYEKDIQIKHILLELLGGTLPAVSTTDPRVIKKEGATYTDRTSQAASPSDADTSTTEDVELMAAAPAVNDAVYFGWADKFNRLSIDVSTAGVGTWTVTWEIWDGAAWVSLALLSDTPTNFDQWKVAGVKIISWAIPSGWTATNLNGTDPVFPNASLFYVRARISAFTSMTTRPLARKVAFGLDVGFALDTSDATQGDDYQPQYPTAWREDITSIISKVLGYTLLGIVLQKDGFHAKFIDNAQASADYTYDSAHKFWESILESYSIIPNSITVTNLEPGTSGTRYSGSDTNTASKNALGQIAILVVDESVTSNATATTQAQRLIKQLVRDANQGFARVPMNCGQEVWDLIQVQDSRSGQTWNGRVSQLVRSFEPGVYEMLIFAGGYRVSEYISEIQMVAQKLAEQAISLREKLEEERRRREQEQKVSQIEPRGEEGIPPVPPLIQMQRDATRPVPVSVESLVRPKPKPTEFPTVTPVARPATRSGEAETERKEFLKQQRKKK